MRRRRHAEGCRQRLYQLGTRIPLYTSKSKFLHPKSFYSLIPILNENTNLLHDIVVPTAVDERKCCSLKVPFPDVLRERFLAKKRTRKKGSAEEGFPISFHLLLYWFLLPSSSRSQKG